MAILSFLQDEHQNVIDDCTNGNALTEKCLLVLFYSFWHLFCDNVDLPALELNPDYLKAVMRRAQSYEALEKYEDALEGEQNSSGVYEVECIHEITTARVLRLGIRNGSLWPLVINKWWVNLFVPADYKRVLELDPSQSAARQAVMVCYHDHHLSPPADIFFLICIHK